MPCPRRCWSSCHCQRSDRRPPTIYRWYSSDLSSCGREQTYANWSVAWIRIRWFLLLGWPGSADTALMFTLSSCYKKGYCRLALYADWFMRHKHPLLQSAHEKNRRALAAAMACQCTWGIYTCVPVGSTGNENLAILYKQYKIRGHTKSRRAIEESVFTNRPTGILHSDRLCAYWMTGSSSWSLKFVTSNAASC